MFTRPGTAIAAAVVLSCLIAGATQAQEGGFEVYGHLNFGVLNYDDGAESKSFLVDNTNSNSRVGFRYGASGDGDGPLGFQFETGLGLLGSGSVNLIDNPDAIDFDRTDLRIFEVVYRDDRFGTLSFGQGSMATDGITGNEYIGTGVIAGPSIADLAGGQFFRQTDGTLSSLTIGDVSSDLDGSRRFRLRYDTPSLSGFEFSVAAGREVLREDVDTEYYDLGIRYVREFTDYVVAAALGHAIESGGRNVTSGSAAVLHVPSQVSFQLAGGAEQDGGSYAYLRAGIRRDWFSFGQTRMSLDLYDGQDFESDGSKTDSWSVALVQLIDDANMEAYAIYREYGFDDQLFDYLDGEAVMVGARWRF